MNRTLTPTISSPLATGAATIAADPALTLLSANDTFCVLFGIPPSPDGRSLLQFLPEKLVSELRDILAANQGQCESQNLCECTEKKTVSDRHPHIHLSAVRIDGLEHAGYPVHHLVCMDLSELAELRRTTALEKQKCDIIADITEDIPFEYDFATDIMTYAEKYRTIFGQDAVIPHFRERLLGGLSANPLCEAFRASLIEMSAPSEETPEAYTCTADGEYCWFSLFCTRLEDETGTLLKAVGAIRNIDRPKREQLRLLDKSRIDAMTGLLNKATTEEEIRNALCNVQSDAMGALMMIDIDNFKTVNDTMGHLAGDAVITQLSRQFLRSFRREDFVGRVGGDEFHVFMRNVSDIASVHEKARSICTTVRKLFVGSELDNLISISVGVTCTETPIPYSELFRQADVALYRAKANGKNRYEFFGRTPLAESEEDTSHSSSLLEVPVARNSIVVDIVDTLFSMNDIRKGIDKALEFIGHALNVDVISIYEKSLDFKTLSITHEWTARNEWSGKHRFQNVPIEEVRLPQSPSLGSIYYCNDIKALPPEERDFSLDPSVTSLLQCDIVRDGMLVGLLSFEERGTTRIWTQQEIDALILLSKLLNGHISQKQSANLLRQSNEATRDILNSLPETFVCVLSKTGHRLLYFNDRVAEHSPHARLGMPCHKFFKNREYPCEFCSCQRFNDDLIYCTQLRGMPFGKETRLSVSNILWENREPAYVTLVSKHEPTLEEREQQKKKESYIHALCTTYDYVIDIDCISGQYELLALSADLFEAYPMTGDYNTVHYAVAESAVHPEDRDTFTNCCDLQGMLKAFADGATTSELEYKLLEKNQSLWKIRTALPYALDGDSPRILIYIRDITTQKTKELHDRAQQVNYLLALQSNYSEIFRINLEARTIVPLFYNSEQVFIPSNTADIQTFFHQRADNRVHAEDLEKTLAFYNPDEIREKLHTNGIAEMEYRKRQTMDGDYRWISATIRPVPDSPNDALLLMRDVTPMREEEANFYTALKDIYAGMYEVDLDMDTVRQLSRNADLLKNISLTNCYTIDTDTINENCVFPEDRNRFLQDFDIAALRQAFEENRTVVSQCRIYDSNDQLRWVDIYVLPLCRTDARKSLILCLDVTEPKLREQANARIEHRYAALFRQSCDMLTEVSLSTGTYTSFFFTTNPFDFPIQGDYADIHAFMSEKIHPEDRNILALRTIEALRKTCEEGTTDSITRQYRLKKNDAWYWMESRAFFVNEGGEKIVVFLTRDINAEKVLEEERNLETQRFAIALRDTYTEIYELNTDTNTSKLLFSNSNNLRPVGVDDLVDTQAIINNALHPADRERVSNSFSGVNIRARFAEGCPEVREEFRRLGLGNEYHWVSALIVPLRESNGMGGNKTMLLVNDISQRKTQEQHERRVEQYALALRNIYDELYEFNITQDTFQRTYREGNKYLSPPESGVVSETTSVVAETMVHPEDRKRFYAFFDMTLLHEKFTEKEYRRVEEFRRLCHTGEYEWVAMTMFPIAAGEGDDEIYLLFNMNIDVRKKADALAQQNTLLERQRFADERYKIIVEQTNTLVFEWWPETKSKYISPDLIQRFAGVYDDRDLMRIWEEDHVVHPDDSPAFEDFILHCRTRKHTEMTVRFRKHDNSYIWCKVVLSCLRDEWARPYRYIGTLNDVDNATCSVIALQYRAEYDTLTGVYNMQTFHARAAHLLRENPERNYSIVRMDLDRFKVINDLYGMEEGDLLLKTIARLLSERMSPYCVCGHFSGDIFCACVDFTRAQILDFVNEMNMHLAQYPLASRVILSFGICKVDNIDTPINVLCDWANLALKTVKGNVLVSHAFYDGTLRNRILDEKKIETEMHDSLMQEEFNLYLQPKVHIASSQIVGSEGLVRWRHPTDGIIPPDRFIPLFEKNGFIIRLDEYIWKQACVILRNWLDRGLTPTPISVNVSRMHVHDTRLCEKLLALIQYYDLPPHLLELELTESVFLDSESQLFDSIRELRECGFLLSLDDFGAGYSSLNMLKSLPIKTIKIDRGFLNEVVATERGKTIIRHTIALSRDLNMEVIAEGVENRDQAAFLLDAGCFVAQGFYYSPPVPLPIFEKMAFSNICPFPLAPSLGEIHAASADRLAEKE